jgi:DNA polymerase III alpha subunit
MIVRTEFSLRAVFGPVKEVVAALPPWGGIIADDSTFGHVPFAQACKAVGKRAVLGRRFPIAGGGWVVAVPRSPAGLRALYGVPVGPLDPLRAAEEDWWTVIPGCFRVDWPRRGLRAYVPGLVRPGLATSGGFPVAFSDNFYPRPTDRETWRLMLGRLASGRPGPSHILSADELALEGATEPQLARLRALVEESDTPLPKAENIRFPVPDAQASLAAAARSELIRRGLAARAGYRERLEYELNLIGEKSFADYFLVIADMMAYAKKHMLVGPARGSSCGSLVCWVLRITEVDPMEHKLLFERFIDVNRHDLPDIDIDFQDDKRHLVIEYLAEKYGAQNVAQIGTVMRYKPKSALIDIAKSGNVPLWELDKLKDVMIERSSGDSRYSNQLSDSLETLDVGKALVARYPVLRVAGRIEGHARSAGTHAAGIIVCNAPVREFCSVGEDGTAQIDKKMAEALNMLKIDALGLRTLSVIAECCALIGKPVEEMYTLPLDDGAVFALFNEHKYSSIFQFEGPALRSVARQTVITSFADVAAITALARPGPLSGGETVRWIAAKAAGEVRAMHPALEPYTRDTYGCIVYQEQVMRVCFEVGGFSWADTSKIRKVMSDRKGNEEFGRYAEQFRAGAARNGVEEADARRIWKAIDSMGSWAFNQSHAVAYGMVSYWTAWLKAHHSVPFAVANLRHARDDDSAKATLRELMREGAIEFIPVDRCRSTERWEFADGALLGPLTGLPGCGEKTAREILMRRATGVPLAPRHQKILAGESKFADYAPTRKRWGALYDAPQKWFERVNKIEEVSTLMEHSGEGEFCVIGRLVKKNLRDLNDDKWLLKREGKRVPEDQSLVLFFTLEDDTGQVICRVGGDKYARLGKKMVEEGALGMWYAVTGRLPDWDFKLLFVENIRWLDERIITSELYSRRYAATLEKTSEAR